MAKEIIGAPESGGGVEAAGVPGRDEVGVHQRCGGQGAPSGHGHVQAQSAQGVEDRGGGVVGSGRCHPGPFILRGRSEKMNTGSN